MKNVLNICTSCQVLRHINGCPELDEFFFLYSIYSLFRIKIFFLCLVWFQLNPLTRANAQWVIHGMGLICTLIYTSELILCSTICVPSATRHNMYPYFLFAAIHNLKSSPTFSMRPRSSVGRVTVNLIRRSWVDFHRGQNIFFLCLVWFTDLIY